MFTKEEGLLVYNNEFACAGTENQLLDLLINAETKGEGVETICKDVLVYFYSILSNLLREIRINNLNN